MKHVNRARLAGLSAVVAVAACAEPVDRISAPNATPSEIRALEPGSSKAAERAALEEIGRVVGISLGDKGMRHLLKKNLRAAPFKEHKLELSRYLRSSDGKQLLAKLGAGKKSDAVLTLLDQVRPLELHMPVRKHRETWIGDEEALVAVQLEERDPIIAFDGRGTRIQLDLATPPEQPTISIVPVETRFDRPMPVGSLNVGDMHGKAIGTLMPAGFRMSSLGCMECVLEPAIDGLASGSRLPPGLYLEFSRILDLHEPWLKSSPEIEVHIQGPSNSSNPNVGDDLSCSGEEVFDHRKYFDQNDGFWQGKVMLFSQDEVTRFNSRFGDGFHVMFWEDDDTPCLLKLDNDVLMELLKSSATFGAVALKVVSWTWGLAASAFVTAFFTNPGEWLRTNDDFVGVAVPIDGTAFNYPENTHVILKGGTLNGRANIVYYP